MAHGTSSTLTGHTSSVEKLVLLKNGDLASSSNDADIRIWDLATDASIQPLIGHNTHVHNLIQLANCDLASESHNDIRIWHDNNNCSVCPI